MAATPTNLGNPDQTKYGSLTGGGYQNTGDWGDFIQNCMADMERSGLDAGEIGRHTQMLAPAFFSNLLKTGAARDLMDTDRMMATRFQPAAAKIGAGTEASLRNVQNSLAMSGLSASGAMPMLQGQLQSQQAGQMGDMLNRMLTEQAYTKWGMTRDVAGMGFGYAPMGQVPGQGTDWAALAGAGGQVIGSWLGGLGTGQQASQ
jgi:hypothetical protein